MKVTRKVVVVAALAIVALLSACDGETVEPTTEPVADMANPAAVFCEEKGGDYEIREDDAGNQDGVCIFEDGSECGGWDYYRGGCAPRQPEASGGGSDTETEEPIGMANPASVHCEEEGGTLEMREDTDGGQFGMCIFEDGSECEEWAFFRGECVPSTESDAPMPVIGWFGTIVSPPAGQPFDTYLVLSPKESGGAGLVPLNEDAKQKLDDLVYTDRMAHIWGTRKCNTDDYAGCLIEVTQVRPDGPGEPIAPSAVAGWAGTLQSLPAGAQFDDVFVLADEAFPVQYGIEPADEDVASQFDRLRDTGRPFAVYGELTCGVIDVNGCQILARRIMAQVEVEMPVVIGAATSEGVNDWIGLLVSLPEGAQFDDQFERLSFEAKTYGIEGATDEIKTQIADLRDTDTQVHIWGKLLPDVIDVNGMQIVVTRIETNPAPEPPEVIIEDVVDWVGVVVSMPEAPQIDDYFQKMDRNGTRVGIWGEGEIGEQLEALRDTGTVIHVWGIVRYNVPDANNAQITVARLETE